MVRSASSISPEPGGHGRRLLIRSGPDPQPGLVDTVAVMSHGVSPADRRAFVAEHRRVSVQRFNTIDTRRVPRRWPQDSWTRFQRASTSSGKDLGLLAVGQLEQVVGQRDALAAGPLVDEEAGLGGLAAAADVEGVDDVGEAEPDRGLGELFGIQIAAVAGPAGVQELAFGPTCFGGPRPAGARRGRPRKEPLVPTAEPRPMTWAGRTWCRKRAASAPSAAASTTGSSSNTSTKLGNIAGPRGGGVELAWRWEPVATLRQRNTNALQ